MNKHNVDITELLARWLRGEATAQDEQTLEKAAREDDFLAEALQGYRQHPTADHAARTARLRQRIDQTDVPKSGFAVWRIAAAIALLLVAGTVFYQLQPQPADERMAAEAQPKKEVPQMAPATTRAEEAAAPQPEALEAPALPQPTGPLAEARADVETEDAAPEMRRQAPMTTTADAPALAESDDAAPLQKADKSKDESRKELAKNSPADLAKPAPATAPPAAYTTSPPEEANNVRGSRAKTNTYYIDGKRVTGELAEEKTENVGLRPIFGRIVDPTGDPIIGASISILDTPIGAITDIRGEFEMMADSTQHTMQIDYIGYNSLQITIPAGGAISERFTIDDEAMTLDELQIVTGMRQTRVKKLEPIAMPEGGRSAFNRYVDREAARGLPNGKVRLRFMIDAEGNPYNVRIDKSNNPVLNSSAMHLLLNGPRWVIIQGLTPLEMVYTVKF